MIIIPIKLSSIKLKPIYKTNSYTNGRVEATFDYKGEPLDWINEAVRWCNEPTSFNNDFFITSYYTKNDNKNIIQCSGAIINPYDIPKKFLVDGFNIFINNKLISPKYLYKYVVVKLKCFGCESMINVDDIEHGYKFLYKKCPKCGELDSFSEYKYEKIEDALKGKKVNERFKYLNRYLWSSMDNKAMIELQIREIEKELRMI